MTEQKQKQKQAPLFEATAQWFHIFKQMIESGDLAKMGPHAATVYLVIKSYVNFKTGHAFPEVDTIVEKSGMSRRQVLYSINKLVEFNYITKEKKGRKNQYRLREKLDILDKETGRPAAVATWDYIPSAVTDATAEIRNFLMTGDSKEMKVVHIENLTLNIQQNFASHNQQTNFSSTPEDIERLYKNDPKTKEQMLRLMFGKKVNDDKDKEQ